MTTPHVNNAYDHQGKLRQTIILDNRVQNILEIRRLMSKIELELMEPHPDEMEILAYVLNIYEQLEWGFSV